MAMMTSSSSPSSPSPPSTATAAAAATETDTAMKSERARNEQAVTAVIAERNSAAIAKFNNIANMSPTMAALESIATKLSWRRETTCQRALSAKCAFGDYHSFTVDVSTSSSMSPFAARLMPTAAAAAATDDFVIDGDVPADLFRRRCQYYYVYVAYESYEDAIIATHLLRRFGTPRLESLFNRSVARLVEKRCAAVDGGDDDDFCDIDKAIAAPECDVVYERDRLREKKSSVVSTLEWHLFHNLGVVRSSIGASDNLAPLRARRHRLPYALVVDTQSGEPFVRRFVDGSAAIIVVYDFEHESMLTRAENVAHCRFALSDGSSSGGGGTIKNTDALSSKESRNYCDLATVDSLLAVMRDYTALVDDMASDPQCPQRPCLGAVGGSPPATAGGVVRCIAALTKIANSGVYMPWQPMVGDSGDGSASASASLVVLKDILLPKSFPGSLTPSALNVYETLFGLMYHRRRAAVANDATVDDGSDEVLCADPIRGLDLLFVKSSALATTTAEAADSVPCVKRYIARQWLQREDVVVDEMQRRRRWDAVALLVRILSRRVMFMKPSDLYASQPSPHIAAAIAGLTRNDANFRPLMERLLNGTSSPSPSPSLTPAGTEDTVLWDVNKTPSAPCEVIDARALFEYAVRRYLRNRMLHVFAQRCLSSSPSPSSATQLSDTRCVTYPRECSIKIGHAECSEMQELVHAHEMSVHGDAGILADKRSSDAGDLQYNRPNVYAGYAEHAFSTLASTAAASVAVLVVLTGASSERLYAVRLDYENTPRAMDVSGKMIPVDRMLSQSTRSLVLKAVAETLLRAHESARVGVPNYVDMRVAPSDYSLFPKLLVRDCSSPISWQQHQQQQGVLMPGVSRIVEPTTPNQTMPHPMWGGAQWSAMAVADYFVGASVAEGSAASAAVAAGYEYAARLAPPEMIVGGIAQQPQSQPQPQKWMVGRTRRESALWSTALLALNVLHCVHASRSPRATDLAPLIDTEQLMMMAAQPHWSIERCVATLAPTAPDWIAWTLCRMLQLQPRERNTVCLQTLPYSDVMCLGFDAQWAYKTTVRFDKGLNWLATVILHEGNTPPPPSSLGAVQGNRRLQQQQSITTTAATATATTDNDSDGGDGGDSDGGDGGDDSDDDVYAKSDLQYEFPRLASFPAWPLKAMKLVDRQTTPVTTASKRASDDNSAVKRQRTDGPTRPTTTTTVTHLMLAPDMALAPGSSMWAFIERMINGHVPQTDAHSPPSSSSSLATAAAAATAVLTNELPMAEMFRRHYERARAVRSKNGWFNRVQALSNYSEPLVNAYNEQLYQEIQSNADVAEGLRTKLYAFGVVRYVIRYDALYYPNMLRVRFDASPDELLSAVCDHIDVVGTRFVTLPVIARYVDADNALIASYGVGVDIDVWQRVWDALVATRTLVYTEHGYAVPNRAAHTEVAGGNGVRFAQLLGTLIAKMLWDRYPIGVRVAPWLLSMCMAMTLVVKIKINEMRRRNNGVAYTGSMDDHMAMILQSAACSDQLVTAALDNQLMYSGYSMGGGGVAWGAGGEMLQARTVRCFMKRRAEGIETFGDTYLHEPTTTLADASSRAYAPAVVEMMRGFCLNITVAMALTKIVGPREAFRALGADDRQRVRGMSAADLLRDYVRPCDNEDEKNESARATYQRCLAKQLRLNDDDDAKQQQPQVAAAAAMDVDSDCTVAVCETCMFMRYMLERDAAVNDGDGNDEHPHVLRFIRAITNCADIRDDVGAQAAANSRDRKNTIFLDYSITAPTWPHARTCGRILSLPVQRDKTVDEPTAYAEFCVRMDHLLSETRIFNS